MTRPLSMVVLIALLVAPSLAQDQQGRPFDLDDTETNLALGKSYLYSSVPSYRLTTNATDLQDLTDGRLSSRNDDRIWFDATAVAWSGDPNVNIQLDLGQVEPIREIGIRLLGGAEQGGLKFPNQVIALLSDDATQWRQVAAFDRLSDADLQAFGVPPEEGVAYTYPLRFRDLRAAGRYVGIVIHGQTSFIASDEMWVFKGAHQPAEATAGGPFTGEFLVHQFTPGGVTAFFPKSRIFACDNVQAFQTLQGYDNRPEETNGKACDLIIDLPEGITLRRWLLNTRFGGSTVDEFEMTTIEDDAGTFTRCIVPTRGVYITEWGTLFFTTDRADGWTATVRLGCRWDGGMQEPESYAIEAVHVEAVERFEQLHISMAWMAQQFWSKWPDFLESYKACGFNAVPIFPRYAKPDDAALFAQIDQARAMGLDIVNNSSPLHAVQGQIKEHPEVACQLPAGPSNWLCPSYRGELWQQEVELVAQRYCWTKAEWFFYDCEVFTGWYGGGRKGNDEAQSCSRCSADFEGFVGTWDEFIANQGAEFYRAVDDRVREIAPDAQFQAGAYGVLPERIYHDVWDWKTLYPELHQFAMPSLYGFRPADIGDAIRRNRLLLTRSDIIPWLQPGDLGEMPAETLRCILLETLLNGARGAAYYTSAGFDGADMRAVSQVVAMLRPVEQMVIEGSPLFGPADATALSTLGPAATADIGTVRLSGINAGKQALLMVAEYDTPGEVATTITLPPAFRLIGELTPAGRTPMTAEDGAFIVTLDALRARVYLLGAE